MFELDSRRGSYMSHEDLEYLQHYSILDQTMSPIREVTSSNQQSSRSGGTTVIGGTKCQVSTDEMSSIGSSRSSNRLVIFYSLVFCIHELKVFFSVAINLLLNTILAIFRNFIPMRRRSSLIAGVPGDACQGRHTSSSSSSGGNIKEEDLRSFIVATPVQLKRSSNDNDVSSMGLLTNGKPIRKPVNNPIAQPRSRRSSLASSDSPRLVTTPGRRNSMTPRSRRNSLVVADTKMEKRRLSLSLVLEKAYEGKENNTVYALISPQPRTNKNEIRELKSTLMTSQLHEINKTTPCNANSTLLELNNCGKNELTVLVGKAVRITSPLSPGYAAVRYV
jgi:hypothetical protein